MSFVLFFLKLCLVKNATKPHRHNIIFVAQMFNAYYHECPSKCYPSRTALLKVTKHFPTFPNLGNSWLVKERYWSMVPVLPESGSTNTSVEAYIGELQDP